MAHQPSAKGDTIYKSFTGNANMFSMYKEKPEKSTDDDCSYIEEQNVRITPRRLILTNPFEGKKFEAMVVITNVGTAPAFIRILHPSSSAIKLNILKEGKMLCSGMSIKRRLVYKVVMMTLVSSCIIPVCINDIKTVNIHIDVVTTSIRLVALPSSLVDFGFVDAGPTPAKRKLTLANNDVKPCKFTIDLGPNEMDLFVEPSHGIIMGNESVELEIALMLLKEGKKSTEFWIITENPLCIHIEANIFRGRLEALFTYEMRSFSFIKFPNTYFGITSNRQLVIRNNSQEQSFFCVMGEIELQTFSLKEAKEIVADFKYFTVYPEDGKLLPNDVRVFNFQFAPMQNQRHDRIYYCVMLRFHKLYCKDLNPKDYEGGIVFEPLTTTSQVISNDAVSLDENSDFLSTEEPLTTSDDNFGRRMVGLDEWQSPEQFFESDLRVMLYGQFESPNVSLVPDEIVLNDLTIKEPVRRVLQFQNNSSNLSIYCRFKKYPCVNVEPLIVKIEPKKKIEVTIIVTPQSYQITDAKLTFELLDYNMPYQEGEELVLLGKIRVPLHYDVQVSEDLVEKKLAKRSPRNCYRPHKIAPRLAKDFVFDKSNSKPNPMRLKKYIKDNVLLAHPDDRPPNNMNTDKKNIKTIYAGIPRYNKQRNTYALPIGIREHLKKKRDIANKLIRKAKNPKREKTPESSCMESFEEASPKCVSFKDYCEDFTSTFYETEFIPLAPFQLNHITITPRTAIIEQVAFNSSFIHTLKIENFNDIALRIFLKSHKQEFHDFINGDRFTISARGSKEISFKLTVDDCPTNNCNLDIVVNNCYVFQTSVIIKACPKHLTLNTELLTFFANEPNYKFVQLSNLLNVDIDYQWHIPPEFTVEPIEGQVTSGKVQACMISFKIGEAENMVYNLGIHTENKFYNLHVIVEGSNYKVTIPSSVPFGNLSLHVPASRVVVVNSLCTRKIEYEVNKDTLLDGVTVSPTKGWILPCGSIYLTVTVQPTTMGDFKCQLDVLISNTKHCLCDILFRSTYPAVSIMPETIRFRKIAASSFDIACFTVKNNSEEGLATIQFDLDRVPEFNYSEFTNTDYVDQSYTAKLGPGVSKEFSIHYYPFYPLVTSFPLPLIINGISANQSMPQLGKMAQAINRPTMKVYTQVLSYRIEVKSWKYSFKYFPHFDFKSLTKHTISIKNPMKIPLKFCIRLDELQEPFDFKPAPSSVRNVVRYDCAYLCELSPDHSVTFEAFFAPVETGDFAIKLPVFLKDDFSEDMHNYFYFTGEYPAPTYSFDDEIIHLGFIPLIFTIYKKIAVKMEYHSPDCDCEAFIDDPNAYLEIENTRPQGLISSKKIQIVFSSGLSHLMYAKLTMFCSCTSKNFVIPVYGGSENNFLTVHSCIAHFSISSMNMMREFYDAKQKNVNTGTTCITFNDAEKEDNVKHSFDHDLPCFERATSPVYSYMNEVVTVVETWIHEQVFYSTKSYSIPDTICIPEIKTYGEKLNKKEIYVKLPFIMILTNLAGTNATNKFDYKYQERKPMSVWMRKLYKDIIGYLLAIGCYVNYIKPEYLLTYELYQDYMMVLDREKSTHHEEKFLSLAKQSWLELLLQTYKAVVYKKISHYLPGLPIVKKKSTMSLCNIDRSGGLISEIIFSDQGMTILNWIDKHFQEQKGELIKLIHDKNDRMMSEHLETLEHRRIYNFTDDLSDCLPFATILMAYCPFFGTLMKDLYVPPTCKQQNFHNAYVVMELFQKLQISFKMLPSDFTQPNPVKMLMFLTYLYDFMIPLRNKECITFEATLSQSNEECVLIANETQHQLKYNVIFFDNQDDLFSVDDTALTVEPDSNTKLQIIYWAKFLRVQKTILYLCGEIPGNQYANSKIYYLVGHYTLAEPSQDVEIVSPIYKTVQFKMKLVSPYVGETTYDLFLCKEIPFNLNDLEMIPYASLYATKTLSRTKFDAPNLESDEQGNIEMSGSICSIVNSSSTVFMIARSAVVGDFMFKFVIDTKATKKVVPVKLHMLRTLSEFPCTCPRRKPDPKNAKCPRNGILSIPSRNSFLWKAVMDCFLFDRPGDETAFWEEYKNTLVGSHIIQGVLNDHKKFVTEDMAYFMKTRFTFDMFTKQGDSVCIPKKIVFDTEAGDTTDIPVHLTSTVKSFDFRLEAVDKKETRRYKVSVVYDKG